MHKKRYATFLSVGALAGLVLQSAVAYADISTEIPASQKIRCGSTGFTLDTKTAKMFKKAKVSVSAVNEKPSSSESSSCTAKLAGKNQFLFPVTSGSSTGVLRVDHRNGLRIKRGRKSILLNAFTLQSDADGKSVLVANITKTKRLNLASFNIPLSSIKTKGAVTTFSGTGAKLSSAAASALNKALGEKNLLKKGAVLGTVNTAVEFAAFAIKDGTTTVALDPTAAAALQAQGISVSPIDPATAGSSGLVFPVKGGDLGTSLIPSTVIHSGGLAFVKGSTRLELKNFEINLTSDKTAISAETGTSRQDILNLVLPAQLPDTSSIDPGKTPVVISGVGLKLNAGAALVLNQVFATTGFADGLMLGTATVQLNLK